MRSVVVKSSTVHSFDNWSAEFHVNAKDLIDKILKLDLNRMEIISKIVANQKIIFSNEVAAKMALTYSLKTIAATIGGYANASYRLTASSVNDYLSNSINKDLPTLRKALVVSLVMIHSIKNNQEDIEKFILNEFARVTALKDSMEVLVDLPEI